MLATAGAATMATGATEATTTDGTRAVSPLGSAVRRTCKVGQTAAGWRVWLEATAIFRSCYHSHLVSAQGLGRQGSRLGRGAGAYTCIEHALSTSAAPTASVIQDQIVERAAAAAAWAGMEKAGGRRRSGTGGGCRQNSRCAQQHQQQIRRLPPRPPPAGFELLMHARRRLWRRALPGSTIIRRSVLRRRSAPTPIMSSVQHPTTTYRNMPTWKIRTVRPAAGRCCCWSLLLLKRR